MTDSKKRIALKPHINQIREWVDAGKDDDWIADALGTSASSVQSFRSRNDIYRREPAYREPVSVFEGVLDHGERDGWGMWMDSSVAEDPIWREHWSTVDAVVVKVAQDSIVLEPVPSSGEAAVERGAAGDEILPNLPLRERGRIKWFDPDKGYGFIVRFNGEDLFVHHSEFEGDPSTLKMEHVVEYEVGKNERGPFARKVRLFA